MTAPARVPIFVNPGAGSAPGLAEIGRRLTEVLDGFPGPRPLLELSLVAPEALADLVRAEVAGGATVIGVGGGDGTMRSAAAAVADTGATLLCVPLGTLNSFAHRLGIHTIEDAAAALSASKTARMPLGVYDGGVFLNTLTFGEYPRIVRLREKRRRWAGKWGAALIAFPSVLLTLRRVTVTLDVGAGELTRRTAFVWIGIGWGSFPRVTEAGERRANQDLEIVIANAATKWRAAAFVTSVALDMLRGRAPIRVPGMEVLHTRSLTVAASRPLDATADGEVIRLPARVNIELRDQALLLLCAPTPDS